MASGILSIDKEVLIVTADLDAVGTDSVRKVPGNGKRQIRVGIRLERQAYGRHGGWTDSDSRV